MTIVNKLLGKKIFYLFTTNQPVEELWQNYHFIDELKKHDIGFELFNANDYPEKSYEEIMLDRIKSKRNEIAFFFTANTDWQISVSTILEIKKLAIPTLLICYDNLSVPYNHHKVARYFDLVWLTSFETEFLFKQWGAKTVCMPYAANPYKFFPAYEKKIPAIGFIGSVYGARGYKIKQISDSNIPVRIYSSQHVPDNILKAEKVRWSDYPAKIKDTMSRSFYLLRFREGRKLLKGDFCKAIRKRIEKELVLKKSATFFGNVSFEEMNRLYSNFELSLGITEVWNTYLLNKPLYKLHLRTFEIPMCGGLQITSRCSEIEQYFNDGKEIILYGSNDEMIDKMRFYLKDENDTLSLNIKKAARKRSENEHTWYDRFSKIFSLLFT